MFKPAAPHEHRAAATNASCQIHPLPALGFGCGAGREDKADRRTSGDRQTSDDRQWTLADAVGAGPFNSHLVLAGSQKDDPAGSPA